MNAPSHSEHFHFPVAASNLSPHRDRRLRTLSLSDIILWQRTHTKKLLHGVFTQTIYNNAKSHNRGGTGTTTNGSTSARCR